MRFHSFQIPGCPGGFLGAGPAHPQTQARAGDPTSQRLRLVPSWASEAPASNQLSSESIPQGGRRCERFDGLAPWPAAHSLIRRRALWVISATFSEMRGREVRAQATSTPGCHANGWFQSRPPHGPQRFLSDAITPPHPASTGTPSSPHCPASVLSPTLCASGCLSASPFVT